ncbi:gliding motility-associated ABC transporter ATP-binding subunit GldA [Carboxylicivirga sp. M1479]|uniref:gliding motility-associated ABC transporter ATP-binding subunit GldA n=1 Tax=Carboxylicivirga sp. M1479 TaxID=2594476 RepID=UPI001177CACD|nr:gliding motility-associated ABC transporter ATP-binding subunit GldA [Carboxylicivirga sp. M1479]TRX71028.1 gliding motility-associated ABC transporter ATP-binding subunit GldA [Carboxylicivirga sp. M1479]
MSIVVKDVVKEFGKQQALKGVSFSISSGEIVGFLGPNGAGKSTMMKIISGLLPQSAGEVEVCGISNNEYNESFRKKIGYLPEHNPLYLDMYVREYLLMVAQLYQLPNKKERVAEMVELTGLALEQNKKIGALSKGYRQRVGLAQALIHDPEVLILDEPTTGLDPNQIMEIRNLIKTIGKEKTVMLSTHIMQEVEAICERVIILNRGELLIDHPSTDLSALQKSGSSNVFVEFDQSADSQLIKSIDGILSVNELSATEYSIEADTDVRKAIFNFAVQNQLTILTMTQKEQNLESVFHGLTK